MTKDQIMDILPKIVAALTSDETKAKLDAAAGDLGQILTIVMEVQGGVLVGAGVEPANIMEAFTALSTLEKDYADDAEVMALAAELKAKVEAAKGN